MSAPVVASPGVRVEPVEEGGLWRIVLATPKGNILDGEKIAALDELFDRAGREPRLKAVLLDSEGPNFSFGASVQAHLPGTCEAMIPAFDSLCRRIVETPVALLATVRGQCLGGALELVLPASRVFAAHDARLGLPEIQLAVFPPVASVLLTERVGRGAAEDLCLSGRSLSAEEAHRLGLVDEVVEDPAAAALDYARQHLLPRSASSLRLALRAVRAGLVRRLAGDLAEAERLYLGELMTTPDAVEGLRAFLDKRPPRWEA